MPAKTLESAAKTKAMRCPGDQPQKLVEFMCQVSPDLQPGYYDLKFQDYQYGHSTEGASSQWVIGMAGQKANVRIVPKITDVVELPKAKGLLVRGMGLDSLNYTTQYNGISYGIVNASQDHMELVPIVKNTSNFTQTPQVDAGTTGTLGPRGLLREFWFSNSWPDQLDAMGDAPNFGRASALSTPIEDASGAAPGFAERLSGISSLVLP